MAVGGGASQIPSSLHPYPYPARQFPSPLPSPTSSRPSHARVRLIDDLPVSVDQSPRSGCRCCDQRRFRCYGWVFVRNRSAGLMDGGMVWCDCRICIVKSAFFVVIESDTMLRGGRGGETPAAWLRVDESSSLPTPVRYVRTSQHHSIIIHYSLLSAAAAEVSSSFARTNTVSPSKAKRLTTHLGHPEIVESNPPRHPPHPRVHLLQHRPRTPRQCRHTTRPPPIPRFLHRTLRPRLLRRRCL